MQQQSAENIDLAGLVADLNNLLRLKTTVIGMKLFARVADMEAIPKIRRPNAVHTTDQIVSMASRLGWTVGITGDDLVGHQCRAVIGLAPQDEKRLAGRGDADGAKTPASRQGDCRHEGAGQKRPALSDPALWNSKRRPRRHGRELREEVKASHELCEIRHRRLWRDRFHRPARRRI